MMFCHVAWQLAVGANDVPPQRWLKFDSRPQSSAEVQCLWEAVYAINLASCSLLVPADFAKVGDLSNQGLPTLHS